MELPTWYLGMDLPVGKGATEVHGMGHVSPKEHLAANAEERASVAEGSSVMDTGHKRTTTDVCWPMHIRPYASKEIKGADMQAIAMPVAWAQLADSSIQAKGVQRNVFKKGGH